MKKHIKHLLLASALHYISSMAILVIGIGLALGPSSPEGNDLISQANKMTQYPFLIIVKNIPDNFGYILLILNSFFAGCLFYGIYIGIKHLLYVLIGKKKLK
jgi:hypothetical protein